MNPNFIYWELVYADGQVLSEGEGVPYGEAPRRGVHSIRLVSMEHHQVLLNLEVHGNEGFFYRRRTQMVQGAGTRVVFLLGIYPDFQVVFDPQVGVAKETEVDISPMSFERRLNTTNVISARADTTVSPQTVR